MNFNLISHIHNEETLLPPWIRVHLSFGFDDVVIIDHSSTDNSVKIIRELAPHWEVRKSRLVDFNAVENDREVMEVEKEFSGCKIALNTTEFLFTPNFRDRAEQKIKENPGILAFGMLSYCVMDPEKHLGFLDTRGQKGRERRFFHHSSHGDYTAGRHSTLLPAMYVDDMFNIWLPYYPYPQCIDRKLAIGARIPQSDKDYHRGLHHTRTREQFEEERREWMDLSSDLLLDPNYKRIHDEFKV